MTREVVEKALKGVRSDKLRESIAKDATLAIRTTKAEKAAMQKAAKALNLTLTEYLTVCHRAVSERLGL